jgi:F-type H+-transporting ATPase subunit b
LIEKLSSLFVLSIRGERMENVTHSFVFLAHWPSAGSFGLNTDILATNLINLTVVVGVLIFFGKGVCASCLFQE